MTVFLRFVGLLNAAVWLGTAILFTFGIEPACYSAEMRATLGATTESYFSGAIASVLMTRYYEIMLACGVVALLHFAAEWLYMGRPRRKFALGLIIGLFALTLLGRNAIQPALTRSNRRHYAAAQPADRQSAAKSFHILKVFGRIVNVLITGGLVVYVWRAGRSSDTLRFVSPVQFRS